MAFKKVGDAMKTEKIYCSCGGEIVKGKCTNCDKDILLGSQVCDSCEKEVIRCMICKLPLKKGQKLSECPNCKNPAHEDHWNLWINQKHNCPLCKKAVLA